MNQVTTELTIYVMQKPLDHTLGSKSSFHESLVLSFKVEKLARLALVCATISTIKIRIVISCSNSKTFSNFQIQLYLIDWF